MIPDLLRERLVQEINSLPDGTKQFATTALSLLDSLIVVCSYEVSRTRGGWRPPVPLELCSRVFERARKSSENAKDAWDRDNAKR